MKVIIIGSGLGGLSCGALLAKNGFEVTVLEKEPVIGGCLQCFMRRGAKFETGMHFIGSAARGQTLHKMMHYLEIADKLTLSPLNADGYDVVGIAGERFPYAMGRHAFVEQLAARFPHQRECLERYFDLVELVSSASTIHSLGKTMGNDAVSMEYMLRSINEVVSSVVSDPLLQKVLVGNQPLYAGEWNKTPFATHAFIMDFYNQSSFRVVGGSDAIAHALHNTIKRYGGRVLTRHQATHIACSDTRATGVEVNHQLMLEADYVISTLHPQRTLELLNTPLLRPIFIKRISEIENTVGCFTVYMEFKEGQMPYMNNNFYGYNDGTPWHCEQYDEQTWPKGYMYMHLCHEEGARFAKTGEILCYMWMKDVARWIGTQRGQRGQEYEDFKRRKAEKLIDSVDRACPGLRQAIKHYYTSTPLTYLDYTGTSEGSMYGVARNIYKGPAGRVPHRTRVPNLFLAGQNTNSHGMLGVMVGTLLTCAEFVPAERLFQQINTEQS